MKRLSLILCIAMSLYGCGRAGQLEDRTNDEAQALGSLRIVPSAPRLKPNAKQTFTVDTNTQALTWTVVNSAGTPVTSGGTVDSTGTYTAPPTEGTFYLKVAVTSTPNISSTVPIVVSPSAPPSMSVNPAIFKMKQGTYQQVTASVWGAPSKNAMVSWRMAGDRPVGTLAFSYASGNATYYLAPYASTLDYVEASFASSSAYVTIQVE